MERMTTPNLSDGAPSRREFMHDVAASSAAATAFTLSGPLARASALATEPVNATPTTSASADRSTVRTSLSSTIAHASGVPLGGIGTGSVEIRPDGYFHDWLIFNVGKWAPNQPESQRATQPDLGASGLCFYLRTRRDGDGPHLRRLGIRADQHDLYSMGWVRSVEAVEFDGRFPLATLRYLDPKLPVDVVGRFFGPIVPHDSRTSGTPGFHADFTIKNTSDAPVEVSLAGVLQNPLAWGAPDRKLSNSIARDRDTTLLTMRTDSDAPHKATIGSLGISVTGGEHSWVLAEFGEYLRNGRWLRSEAFGHTHESFLKPLHRTGRLPSLPGATSPAAMLRMDDAAVEALHADERRKLLDEFVRYPQFRDAVARAEHVKPDWLATAEGEVALLKHFRGRLDAYAGKDRARNSFGDGALCSLLRLAPGEEKQIRFNIAWHFPHHFSALGPELGHVYETWFKDAEEVSKFLVAHADEHRASVLGFADALASSTLPDELAFCWSAQLSTLVKCSWWTRNGLFAIWEGLGCCGFHTTDITYHGSFPILALWPDLQQQQMKMGAAFQRDDGRVHHFFTPDLAHVDDSFGRVDMNPQFVMLVCRDYLWTGDVEYLRKLWPAVVKAMRSTARLDGDGDGLPDHDTRLNTYDVWNFYGTPSYIASLWLGALRAAIRLAHDLGAGALEEEWRATHAKAAPAFDAKLWNGEYYSLWVDGERRDECCMLDQLSGEGFGNLIGIGTSLPRQRILAAMRAVVRYNTDPEGGLVNAAYPPHAKPHLSTHANGQADANWTGIEYATAATMIDAGMFDEAMAVVRSMHDRYRTAGRVWNHVECGDHYYRAMSSWMTLLAVTGFRIDVPRQSLMIAPPLTVRPHLRAPWVVPGGWGTITKSDDRLELHCTAGSLAFAELHCNLPESRFEVMLAGRKLNAAPDAARGLTVLRFEQPVTVAAGQALEISGR